MENMKTTYIDYEMWKYIIKAKIELCSLEQIDFVLYYNLLVGALFNYDSTSRTNTYVDV